MKKAVLFMSVIILLLPVISFADETASGSEIEVMKYNHGAKIRLLQLEKTVMKNSAKAEFIINAIKNNHETAELESILNDFKSLEQQIEDASNNIGDDSVQEFINLKEEAVDLSSQFRTKVLEILTVEEIAKLRIQMEEVMPDKMREIQDNIKSAIKEYNAERYKDIMQKINRNPGSIEGTGSVMYMKQKIMSELDKMDMQQKVSAAQKIAEINSERKIFKQHKESSTKSIPMTKGKINHELKEIQNILDENIEMEDDAYQVNSIIGFCKIHGGEYPFCGGISATIGQIEAVKSRVESGATSLEKGKQQVNESIDMQVARMTYRITEGDLAKMVREGKINQSVINITQQIIDGFSPIKERITASTNIQEFSIAVNLATSQMGLMKTIIVDAYKSIWNEKMVIVKSRITDKLKPALQYLKERPEYRNDPVYAKIVNEADASLIKIETVDIPAVESAQNLPDLIKAVENLEKDFRTFASKIRGAFEYLY